MVKRSEAVGTNTERRPRHGRRAAWGPGPRSRSVLRARAGWETHSTGVRPQLAPGLEQRGGWGPPQRDRMGCSVLVELGPL